MYRCELCNHVSEPRQPAFRVVLETRPRSYPKREKANPCYKRFRDGTKFVRRHDRGGFGLECAREATVCGRCAARIAEMKARVPKRVVVDRAAPRRRTG
jgi:hypothetical protein